MDDVLDALVDHVEGGCGCGFREDRVTDGTFNCFPSSPHSVTYHAQLHGTRSANVSQLVQSIEAWPSENVTIAVQSLRLTLSSACAVDIDVQHCPGDPPISTTGDVTLATASDATPPATTLPTITIVAGAGVVIFLLLTTLIIVVAVTTLVACSRRSRGKMDLNSRHRSVDHSALRNTACQQYVKQHVCSRDRALLTAFYLIMKSFLVP